MYAILIKNRDILKTFSLEKRKTFCRNIEANFTTTLRRN